MSISWILYSNIFFKTYMFWYNVSTVKGLSVAARDLYTTQKISKSSHGWVFIPRQDHFEWTLWEKCACIDIFALICIITTVRNLSAAVLDFFFSFNQNISKSSHRRASLLYVCKYVFFKGPITWCCLTLVFELI